MTASSCFTHNALGLLHGLFSLCMTVNTPSKQGGKLEGPAIAPCEDTNFRIAWELIQHKHAVCSHGIGAAVQVLAPYKSFPLCFEESIQCICYWLVWCVAEVSHACQAAVPDWWGKVHTNLQLRNRTSVLGKVES